MVVSQNQSQRKVCPNLKSLESIAVVVFTFVVYFWRMFGNIIEYQSTSPHLLINLNLSERADLAKKVFKTILVLKFFLNYCYHQRALHAYSEIFVRFTLLGSSRK